MSPDTKQRQNLSPNLKSKLFTIAPTLQPKAVAASLAVLAVCSNTITFKSGLNSFSDFSALKTGSLLSIEFTDLKKFLFNNIDTIEKTFYGLNYAYGFDCLNCDSYFVATFLNNGNSIITTDDGSTYTYTGFGLSVVGGYSWYLEDAISIVLGAGPLFSSESRESENIKSDNGFGTDAITSCHW